VKKFPEPKNLISVSGRVTSILEVDLLWYSIKMRREFSLGAVLAAMSKTSSSQSNPSLQRKTRLKGGEA
jgi:hypothetical protein